MVFWLNFEVHFHSKLFIFLHYSVVVRKKPAKTVDVFGDELADLSDDEEVTENEEKEELHHTGSQSHHLTVSYRFLLTYFE